MHRLITDLAVFDFTEQGMVLIETAAGVSVEEIREKTEAHFSISQQLKNMHKVENIKVNEKIMCL